MRICFFFLFIFFQVTVWAQPCTTPGQNPSTAFPVCGTSTFKQSNVPLCGGRNLPYKGCGNNSGLSDINPFWYKFTCFKSGTLGFLITPNDMRDDYDWELYDITGKNPDDVYTDGNLVVSNNWSGESGLTGASSAGSQLFVCGGFGRPLFSKMPELIEGHNYILLISHFTRTQSGYSLSFGGGTALITDAGTPALQSVEAHCSGSQLKLKISKKIKCSSIATDGSDFYLMPGNIPVTSVTGIGCTTGFDSDSLHLTLAKPLAAGNYTLHIKKGLDNNTLLDYCDNAVSETDRLSFSIAPKLPATIDSLGTLTCAPNQLKVYLSQPIACNSIAANGSDFRVEGTAPISITGATANCASGITKTITLIFSKPIEQEGNFNVIIQNGTDGNTLLSECGEPMAAGITQPFSVKDTVNADFTYQIQYGCDADVVQFNHNAANGVNSWQWSLDEGRQSNRQNPVASYTVFNTKSIRLIASNGFCSDTATSEVVLENFLKADFSVFADNCPKELIPFTGQPTGRIVQHHWDFGDGKTSNAENPEHMYDVPRETAFAVKYTVTDQWGCQQTAQKVVKVYASCLLAVPNAFTPNNDGLNDRLQPLNAIKANDLVFSIYNRWGQKVFETKDWKRGWDGKWNGQEQPASVYIWTLRFTDRDTKKLVEQKGTAALIR